MKLKDINDSIKDAAEQHGRRDVLPATAAYLKIEAGARHLNLVGTDALGYARIERDVRRSLGVDYTHAVQSEDAEADWIPLS